jgi:hypothetical protein
MTLCVCRRLAQQSSKTSEVLKHHGAPLMVLARNLDHVDTRMVERHDGHLAPGYVAEAIRAAAPRFGKVEPSNVTAL